ncbi:glycosyltransferase 87 family protein [Actinopolymorpha rutila]|uniref:Alpha-1,2-mannosyltransferase n=1 Tax=Actinopolymorpha rutila TaxID=446787 RepID=A0A852ZI55_9ACTN|nr:alpha-1,2-mannosyltransferase [Actinopolymorpha rutila]
MATSTNSTDSRGETTGTVEATGTPRAGIAGVVARVALPIVALLAMLPFAQSYGEFWPWQPNTVDLDVYIYTGHVVLGGGDILTARTPDTALAFIYPPVAALLSVPLVFVPQTLLQLVWTVLNGLALLFVLHRAGLRGWRLSLLATAFALVVEPVRATVSFGQINVFLMALVVADLVPGRRWLPRLGRAGGRLLPTGVLTGVSAAIKVTPALFVVMLLFVRRWKEARTVVVTAAVITVATAVVMPRETIGFAKLLLSGDTRTGPAHFLMNQSMLGVVVRLFGYGGWQHYAGLALGAAAGIAGAYVASVWWRRGEPMLAVSLCGLATLLASPLSWTHHYVWVVPLGATVLVGSHLPRSLRWTGAVFVVWVAAAIFKYVLPWGGDVELSYAPWQQLLSVLGPVLGLAVLAVAYATGRQVTREPDRRPLADAAVK